VLRLFSVIVGAVAIALVPSAALAAPYCQANELPAFHNGFAALDAQLGAGMGYALECEHATSYGSAQTTTSGFAYYIKDRNQSVFVAQFMDKFENWALASDGVRFWLGGVDDRVPPPDVPTVSTEICNAPGESPAVRSACVYLYARQLGDPFATAEPIVRESAPSSIVSGVVDTYIDGEFTGWDGETVFRLQNGQIWQQAAYAYTYSYAYSPRVLIYAAGSGWHMQVEGVTDTIQVQRLR
jgi:hypothetical protein